MATKAIQEEELELKRVVNAIEPMPFWLGYKNAKFWRSEVMENAFETEFRDLLQATVGPKFRVEQQFEIKSSKEPRKPGRPEQLDIAIVRGTKEKAPVAIFEIKRSSRITANVIADLKRLHDYEYAGKAVVKRFLVLYSHYKAPRAFVTDGGRARRGVSDAKIEESLVLKVLHQTVFLNLFRHTKR